MSDFSKMLHGLYAITDERLTPLPELLIKVEAALKGGARIVQLRHKTLDDDQLLTYAQGLKALCEQYSALFIVNDRLELARRVDAHGVHLGKDDAKLVQARRMLGSKRIVGISCYNDIQRAIEAAASGADYVAFGSFFPSPTKPEAVRASVDLLREAKQVLDIPVCAIGGITAENGRDLVKNGADMIAVISDLWGARDIVGQAQRLAGLFETL